MDLKKKIVFLTGLRQVGKTWLAKRISGAVLGSVYLSCTIKGDRKCLDTHCPRF
jgi:uncharacterized protein